MVLHNFLNDINNFSDVIPPNDNTRKKKAKVFDKVTELYNNFLDKYFYEYCDLSSERKEELGPENSPIKFKIKGYG